MVFITTYTCKSQQLQQNGSTEIIGTWIAEDDSKVKLYFRTNSQCLDYYGGTLSDTFDYSISHQYGTDIDLSAWLFKMIDQEDSSVRCYEIYGANMGGNNILSLEI